MDTSVLFPFSVTDLMLALTEDGIHDVLRTEALLDEWEEVVTRDHKRTTSTARSITSAIRDFFAENEVLAADYSPLVAEMPGGDPTTTFTWPLRSQVVLTRSSPRTSRTSQPRRSPSMDSKCSIPTPTSAAWSSSSRRKQRPSMSTTQVLDALEKAGVPRFVAVLRSQLVDP